MAHAPQLILASASPRRLALLAQAGIAPAQVIAPDVDETAAKGELPRPHALRLATAKANAVAKDEPDALVLAADTVVVLGRRILPKAADADEVVQCLRMLSGRSHTVITGVAVKSPDARIRTRAVSTRVAFKRLTDAEIAAYATCGEGTGKAGGYAVQGRAEAFVRFLSGSYSNVVGLPLYETVSLLGGAGGQASR